MKRLAAIAILLTALLPGPASAHLGSPDVFYDGLAGRYPVSVTIRMPGVVPGRAQIDIQVWTNVPVTVEFAPIAAQTAMSNTPPPEPAQAVPGAANSFTGELWLMTVGSYSIDVRIRGSAGEGAVQIPVNSVAVRQLALPPSLGALLLALGVVLFVGGIAIIAAAAGESVLPPGRAVAGRARLKYWTAAAVATVVFSVAVFGAKKWCEKDARKFRSRLVEGGWPDMTVNVQTNGSQRILHLKLGEKDLLREDRLDLAWDHGKLLHFYLVRLPNYDAFGHIHPIRTGDKSFEAALPPLPEGDYEALCDLTLSEGRSSTATNRVHIPAAARTPLGALKLKPDPDDSWSVDAVAARDNAPGETVCQWPDGSRVIWKAHPVLRVRQSAGLRFEIQDKDGAPAIMEPYMGMMSHAVVLRSDGKVFAHLHPAGNFSMAAQTFFDKKTGEKNAGVPTHGPEAICGAPGAPALTLPYEFPSEGNYRLWVQIKIGGRVRTAIFDTTVQPPSM